MGASSLSDLSNETILQILSHFCLHCQDEYSQAWDARPLQRGPQRKRQQPDAPSWYSLDRHALFSLSLTSKRFRDLAQSVMYHEFVLGYGDSWNSTLYSWEDRLESFMRTITVRPDLAGSVKIVYIHENLARYEIEDKKKALILEASCSLGIDLPTAWRRRAPHVSDSEKGELPDAYEAFLLSYLDGKGVLEERAQRRLNRAFSNDRGGGDGFKWLNAELVAMLIAQLPNLNHLMLHGGYSWSGNGFPESALSALKISTLPLKTLDLGVAASSLVELAVDLETLNIDSCISWAPSSPMPNLKTLRITNGRLKPETLKNMLLACTGDLAAFEYEAGSHELRWMREQGHCGFSTPPADPTYHFQPSDAIEYLEPHKRTLRLLHLDLTKQETRMKPIREDLDLKGFTALQHLFLSSQVILDCYMRENNSKALLRLLPSSIMSLSIAALPIRHWETGIF